VAGLTSTIGVRHTQGLRQILASHTNWGLHFKTLDNKKGQTLLPLF
jgi:hypothetical protein